MVVIGEGQGERERARMGIDAMKIRVQIRKFSVILFRLCYRSVCKHPFLVGMVCYLLLLHSSFPVLFSLLVSASPVLICTAILLGTLLCFGEPNAPDIETEKEEEEVSHEISSLKKEGVVEDATFVVQKDESFRLERYVGNIDIEEESLVESNNKMIEGHGYLGDYVPLIYETLWEVQFEKQVIEEVKSDFDNLESGKKREIQEENLEIMEGTSHEEGTEDQYSLLQNFRDENLEDNSAVEFNETQNGYLEFSQESSWKPANHDDEEDDDEASDFGSDGAENSSPDASMADILLMLDELHPLLDEEAPRPAHISHDGSDAGSEGSHKSDERSIESEEDVENQADEDEDGDDDNDNKEEAQGSKEDESKSAIKWTEDDQKNLMDLGTLELERNLRLESLISRRRACRNMRLMAEKNLIDLDAADLPINVPSISTARQNPFDFPYNDVPGSAPSVLLPRQNPFDLPYNSHEEKPDLKEDSFQQGFSTIQHRESFFQRPESFSVGPSTLGGAWQERQDLQWKPYFVPERFTTEGTSYHTFQQQLSEASNSKVSSVPDSESVSSALEEDKRINEVDVSHETEMISNVDHASLLVEPGSSSSEEVDSVDDEQVGEGDFHLDGAKITPGVFENHHEVDSGLSESEGATPKELNPSEILLRMGPGEEDYSSRSSLSSLSEIDEKISDVKRGSMCLEPANFQIEGSHISTQTSLDSDFHFVSGLADDNEYREPILESRNDHIDECDISTQSSLDSDFHFTSRMMDESSHREPAVDSTGYQIADSGILKESSPEFDLYVMSGLADDNQEHVLEPRGHHIVESGISSETYHNSDFHLTTAVVDDGQHSDTVYDSSPPSIETFLSFSSLSSDTHRSEMGSPLAMVEDKESEAHIESLEKGASGYKEMLEGSSQEQLPDESEIGSGVVENTGDEITELGLSGVDSNFYGQNGVMKPESAVENVSVDSPASLSDDGSAEEVVAYKEESSHHKQDQLHSLSLVTEIIVDGNKQLDSAYSSYKMTSEECNLPVLEKDYPPLVVEQVSADTELSASEAKPVKDHGLITEKSLGLEQDQVLEHYNYPGETCSPPIYEDNVNEEEDEMKEIDEELLSELDTVGDFSVKEVVGESLHDEQVPENTSVSPEFSFLPKNSSQTDVKPELPVLEVRSVEDIDLAFKQLHEGVNVEEVILPSMVEEQLAEDEPKLQTNSDLRVVEAKSLEDIHIAMKLVAEENFEELVDSRDATAEVNDLASTKEILVLEAKTIEDIDLAFRQLHEGVEVEEVILPSAIEQQLVVDDTKDLGQTCSGLPVVEARSLKDIHIAMKLVSEGNTEELPKLLGPNDKPGHEVASIKEIDSRDSQINEEDTTEDIESSTVEVNGVNSTNAVESSSVQVT